MYIIFVYSKLHSFFIEKCSYNLKSIFLIFFQKFTEEKKGEKTAEIEDVYEVPIKLLKYT